MAAGAVLAIVLLEEVADPVVAEDHGIADLAVLDRDDPVLAPDIAAGLSPVVAVEGLDVAPDLVVGDVLGPGVPRLEADDLVVLGAGKVLVGRLLHDLV